ncbi:MAG: DUF393 domain-containing protein [Planctomycetota bacterium]
MNHGYEFEVFYDGDCPLCLREIRFLQWCDKRRQKVLFTDIAHPTFDPSSVGKTMDQLMAEIHGRLPNGEWVIGVEVFQRLYAATGLGFVIWPTKLPVLRQMADWAYGIFARNRLKWTRRCDANCYVPTQSAQAHGVDSQTPLKTEASTK